MLVLVIVPEGVAVVVGVKAPVWAGTVVNVSVEALDIALLVEGEFGVFSGVVVAVLADVGTDALIGVVIGAGANMLVDIEIIVVAAVSNVFKIFVPVPYSEDMLSDVAVDISIKALSGVMIGVVVLDISVDVLFGVSTNIFVVMMTALRGVTSALVEAFDC